MPDNRNAIYLFASILVSIPLPSLVYAEDVCETGFLRPVEGAASLQFSEIEGLYISPEDNCKVESECTYDFRYQNNGQKEETLASLRLADICNAVTRSQRTETNSSYGTDGGLTDAYRYRTLTFYHIESGKEFLSVTKSFFHNGQEGLATGMFEGDTSAGATFLLGVSLVEIQVGGVFE
jgi:hypothetical protein